MLWVMNTALYTVKDLCTLFRITRKTLFYYDHHDLLKPAVRAGEQQHKLYDEDARIRLSGILQYRNAGLTLSEIRSLLDDPDTDRNALYAKAAERLYSEIQEKERQYRTLLTMMNE